MELDILFEDEHLAVINKPAGVVVHPGAGTKETTLIEGFLHYLENQKDRSPLPGHQERPGIVHRLDKDTSGIMVLAKSDLAMKKLSDQFREKLTSENTYASWTACRKLQRQLLKHTSIVTRAIELNLLQ